MGNNQGLRVRRAEPADDGDLADLFNRAHAHLAGTVVRSAADIGWRCRRQPGMPDDGGVLVESPDGTILGYAFVKTNGDITEMAVAPDGPRGEVATALVGACEDRATTAGATRIRVNVPITDEVVARVLGGAGWAPSPGPGRRYLASIEPARLVRSLASQSDMTVGTVEIVVSDPRPWQTPVFSFGSGPVLRFEADQAIFNEVLLAGSSPWKAVMRRRLRVTPPNRTMEGIRYLEAIRVRAPWFHTLGDVL